MNYVNETHKKLLMVNHKLFVCIRTVEQFVDIIISKYQYIRNIISRL